MGIKGGGERNRSMFSLRSQENFFTPQATQSEFTTVTHLFETSELSGVGVTAVSSEFHIACVLCNGLPVCVSLPGRFNICRVFSLTKRVCTRHVFLKTRLFKDDSCPCISECGILIDSADGRERCFDVFGL